MFETYVESESAEFDFFMQDEEDGVWYRVDETGEYWLADEDGEFIAYDPDVYEELVDA